MLSVNELIRRIDALEIVKRTSGDYATAFCEIKHLPTVDAEPVKHGQWLKTKKEAFWIQDMDEIMKTGKPTIAELPTCSCCGALCGTSAFEFKYCPDCGAKMDGDA